MWTRVGLDHVSQCTWKTKQRNPSVTNRYVANGCLGKPPFMSGLRFVSRFGSPHALFQFHWEDDLRDFKNQFVNLDWHILAHLKRPRQSTCFTKCSTIWFPKELADQHISRMSRSPNTVALRTSGTPGASLSFQPVGCGSSGCCSHDLHSRLRSRDELRYPIDYRYTVTTCKYGGQARPRCPGGSMKHQFHPYI